MPAPSLARSSLVMATGTLASRVLGLVRNALLVAALGATASGAADAFNVANMLPTQLYNLIIGGALNAILVPQIVRALRQKHGEELVNRLLTAAAAIIAGITALLTVASPLVIMAYASGLGRWQPLAFAFAFWCMPQIFFYGLYALWGQVLNARHSFGPYMWSPVLNNIISIGSVLAYLHLYGSYTSGQSPAIWDAGRIALVGGCATAGIAAQALILYIPLVRSGFRPRLVWGVRGLGLGAVSKVAMWALLGTAITALGDLAITNLGSAAVTAAEAPEYAHVVVPSATMYANALMIYMLPQSLVTTSVITALFTRMSEKAAEDDHAGVAADLSLGLRSVGVFTVLFGAGIATLATPALQVFVPSLSLAQAQASGPILALLALGIPFQGLMFTMQRVLLAYERTKLLVPVNLACGAVVVVTCIGARLFAPAPWWMPLAAAGNALGLVASCVVITLILRSSLPSLDGARIASTYVRLILATLPAVALGALIRWALGPADGSLTGTRAIDAALTVILVALVMTLLFLICGRLLRINELAIGVRPLVKITRLLARVLPGRAGQVLTQAAQWLGEAPGPSEGSASAIPAGGRGRQAGGMGEHAPTQPRETAVAGPRAGAGRLGEYGFARTGGQRMGQPTPIGSGRYELDSPLPASLPKILRHSGRDTVLDRPVTILTVTEAAAHREDVLETALRAVLVDNPHLQRVYDVEEGAPGYVMTEPAAALTLADLVAVGLTPVQVRAIVGEIAQALDAASERELYHLSLRPESVRLRADGSIQLVGLGIEAAAQGLDSTDPLAARAADARSLVDLTYYALTGRWPGKRAGIPAAPMENGTPVMPSLLNEHMTSADADLDALIARTWEGRPPLSAHDIAATLSAWEPSSLADLLSHPTLAARQASIADAAASSAQTSHPGAPVDSGRPDWSAGKGAGKAGLPWAAGAAAAGAASAGEASHEAAEATGAAASLGATAAGAGANVAQALSSFGHKAAQAASGAGATIAAGWAELRRKLAENKTENTGEALTPTEPAGQAGLSDTDTTPEQASQASPAGSQDETTTVSSGVDNEGTQPTTVLPPSVPAEETIEGSGMGIGTDDSDQTRRALSRTSALVMTAAAIAVIVGMLLAVSDLLQLANVKIADEDVPAAQTVPTEEATGAPTAAAADTEASPAAQPASTVPIQITGATSLDPDGGKPDHPELTAALYDGDSSTQWYTRYYASSSLAPRSGLGVALQLAAPADLSGIDMVGTGEGGHFEIRATTAEDPTGGTLLAEGSFTSGSTSVDFTKTTTGSVVIWVTELPKADDGKYKVTIGEITLR